MDRDRKAASRIGAAAQAACPWVLLHRIPALVLAMAVPNGSDARSVESDGGYVEKSQAKGQARPGRGHSTGPGFSAGVFRGICNELKNARSTPRAMQFGDVNGEIPRRDIAGKDRFERHDGESAIQNLPGSTGRRGALNALHGSRQIFSRIDFLARGLSRF